MKCAPKIIRIAGLQLNGSVMSDVEKAVQVIEEQLRTVKWDARALNMLDPHHNAVWLLRELAKIPHILADSETMSKLECGCPECPFTRAS